MPSQSQQSEQLIILALLMKLSSGLLVPIIINIQSLLPTNSTIIVWDYFSFMFPILINGIPPDVIVGNLPSHFRIA